MGFNCLHQHSCDHFSSFLCVFYIPCQAIRNYTRKGKVKYPTRYKECAPGISELALLERKKHQAPFLDNQQQSNNIGNTGTWLEEIIIKNWTEVIIGWSISIRYTWRSMLISSSERSVSGMS